MARILVVEDSKFFSTLIKKTIESDVDVEVIKAATLAEAVERYAEFSGEFILALADLVLPDAPDGEIVDYLLGQKLPTIVFTGTYAEDVRERVTSKGVIDYVIKDTPSSIGYLTSIVRRIVRNRSIKALAVDDSSTARKYLADLLRLYQFQVLEASDGEKALAAISDEPDIKLVVTDFHMPNMDGFELIRRVREKKGRDEMAIIGVSSAGGNMLSAKFIKIGANDFITKPFLREEFFCRITQNIDNLELVAALRDTAVRDPLTGLHNRRHFFDVSATLLANAKRKHVGITVAMLDIDNFKKINDTYGHETGDIVLQSVSAVLSSRMRASDLLARIGGEEFAIVCVNMEHASIPAFFERVRDAIEKADIHDDDGNAIKITISIGVCPTLGGSIEEMLKTADEMLYDAKNSGRNLVKVSSL
jgi:diguanylate cyclase (GGDEF)-like protein